MPKLFNLSMFFLSFLPLWLCVLVIDGMSVYAGGVNTCTEMIGMICIGIGIFISTVTVAKVMHREGGQNYKRYKVKSAAKDTMSTTSYLLSNALPLLAFDFTRWDSVITFLIIIGFLVLLCFIHNRYDSNIVMEIFGYHLFTAHLKDDMTEDKECLVLLKSSTMNRNDEIAVRSISDELFLGYKC